MDLHTRMTNLELNGVIDFFNLIFFENLIEFIYLIKSKLVIVHKI